MAAGDDAGIETDASPWAWRFDEGFEEEIAEAVHRFARGFMPWAAGACASYAILDLVSCPPEALTTVLCGRAVMVAVLVACSITLRVAKTGALTTFVSAFAPLATCANLALLTLAWDPGRNLYGSGIAVPAMTYGFLSAKPIHTLFGSAFIALFYLGVNVVFGPVPREAFVMFTGHVFILTGVCFLTVILSVRSHRLRWLAYHRRREVEEERRRSDRLLRNILPDPIAERLKGGEAIIADAYAEVSVVFADIVGFTQLSATLAPEELLVRLNEVFSAFDAICARLGLEKIKTIGDAYMVVGGAPSPRDDHAEACVRMALEMQDVLHALREKHGDSLDVRIGVHSGRIVAGVIGTRKLAFDVWGDTVNTASRMESHSLPGRVQVSDATAQHLAHAFELEERGVIDVKGKGPMKTWFVRGLKPRGELPGAPV